MRYLLLFGLFLSSHAHAFFIELDGFYFSDTIQVTGQDALHNRTLFDGCLGFDLDKKGYYQVGWNYTSHSTSDTVSNSTTTYSSTQMGPRFIFFLNRSKSWSLGVAYNLQTNAVYKAGTGAEEKWEGTAIRGDLGYNMWFTDSSFVGIRFNMNAATYTEKLVNTTEYSEVSYTRTLIYPSLYYGINF